MPAGTVIGTLQAVDEDIGENAAIDYVITGKLETHKLLIILQHYQDSKSFISVIEVVYATPKDNIYFISQSVINVASFLSTAEYFLDIV